MDQFIRELKEDHLKLLEVLENVKDKGIASKEAKEQLTRSKDLFTSHLKKEDLYLYPKLKKIDSRLVESFIKDMDTISKDVSMFFDKYQVESSRNTMQFASDFGRLYAMLKIRLQKEENVLYKEYEKHFSQN